MKNPDVTSKAIYYQIADLFEVSAIYTHADGLLFRTRPRVDKDEAVLTLKKRLKPSGYRVRVNEQAEELLIDIRKTKMPIPRINIILFFLTLLTMFLAPVLSIESLLQPGLAYEYLTQPGIMQGRFEFTITMITILLFHEFGHYLTGRRRGVMMSLPYFLPAPNIAGTFGAIIKSRSPITNRRDLIEVGAAGPIAGFIISVIALVIGLQQSRIDILEVGTGLYLGDSLLLKFLSWLIIGPIPDGYDFFLSPAAFAGWVGLLVTMLNLLPLGQLDGGHIIYGLLGKRQHLIGKLFALGMMILGFWWPGWWFFGILVLLFGIKHPPTLYDSMEIPRHARVMGIVAIIIFIISFIPIPFAFD